MPRKKLFLALVAELAVTLAAFTMLAPTLAVGQEQVLQIFNGTDGANSFSGLVFDPAGNLYGTTQQGGNTGYGTVFKLTRGSNGTWTETVLHNFHGPNGLDRGGLEPSAALVFDLAGNLYGTTLAGGVHGFGVVFKLSPGANGNWTETVLHAFNGEDGGRPAAPLIFDKAGNLYGTSTGAPPRLGNVFELSPGSDGAWTEAVLYTFNGEDGGGSYGGLIFDTAGNLYGTSETGGAYKYFGLVFKLTPGGNGKWRETVLHSFSSANGDGAYPASGLLLDAAGNLFGTAYGGGLPNCEFGCGNVFELTPGAGTWSETILHEFSGGADGAAPLAAFAADAAGNLYSTTAFGGNPVCDAGCGVVFKLTAGANGKWSETVLNSFDGSGGATPWSNVILDGAGSLYGTTSDGGNNGNGVVYEVTQ
jgi:uncharacterized repeat protein (TIGR03803 family)